MKKIIFAFFSFFSLVTLFSSCTKAIGDPPHLYPRSSTLIGITWGLQSARSIDSLSLGIMHYYKGVTSDSLLFLWNLNPNLNIFGLNYIIAGVNTQVSASYSSLSWATVSGADTSTIAYDTIFIAAPWKPNYSDTLFLTKVSQTSLVFQVRYSDSNGSGVEVDSFYKIRNNHNLY